MMSDLEERERNAFAVDPVAKAREDEDRIARKLQEEIARIRAAHARKGSSAMSASKRKSVGEGKETESNADREKMLKVSWEKGVKQVAAIVSSSIHPAGESDRIDNLVGRGYKAYANSVLEKLQKGFVSA